MPIITSGKRWQRATSYDFMTHARYLGDGVYASFDGYGVVLTTGSHQYWAADNRICLEPQVIEDFQRYIKDLKERLAADPSEKPEQI